MNELCDFFAYLWKDAYIQAYGRGMTVQEAIAVANEATTACRTALGDA